MKPHPLVITLLTQVEDVIPKWKIVPTKDVIDAAFKDPVKREKVSRPAKLQNQQHDRALHYLPTLFCFTNFLLYCKIMIDV